VIQAQSYHTDQAGADWFAGGSAKRSGQPISFTVGIKEGSPAIDKAIRLPNINDHFTGSALDIGCFERGSDWTWKTLGEPLQEDPR